MGRNKPLRRAADGPAQTVARSSARRVAGIRMSPLQRVIASLTAMLSLFVGGLVTLALWNAGATHAGGIITAGQLSLVPESFSWTETSADVPVGYRSFGSDWDTLAALKAMPGDSLEIRQGVKITAEGSNLNYDLAVEWVPLPSGNPNRAPRGFTASYLLLDSSGRPVQEGAPTQVGKPVRIEMLPEGSAAYTLEIKIDYAADATPGYLGEAGYTDAVSLPPFKVSTIQVREVG
jgi:alternate signal-mediated exported protein